MTTLRKLPHGTYFVQIKGDALVRRLERGPEGQCYAPVLRGQVKAKWWKDTPVEALDANDPRIADSIN